MLPRAPAGTGAAAVSGTLAQAPVAGTSAPTMTGAVSQAGAPMVQGGAPSTAVAGSGTVPAQAGTGGDVPTPPSGPNEWTMIGYDAGSTYNNTHETVLTKQNAAPLSMAPPFPHFTVTFFAKLRGMSGSWPRKPAKS
jgi:hypothetical protein